MSSFLLKIIALVLMFWEHFDSFLPNVFPENISQIVLYTWRIVAPVFFFLSVEGFHRTSSKKRYLIRLFSWAFIMEVWNFVINYYFDQILPWDWRRITNNIFLSIALWVSMIWSIDTARKWVFDKKSKNILFYWLAVILAFASLFSESSIYWVIMYLIFYFCYGNKKWLTIAYSLICALLFAEYYYSSISTEATGEVVLDFQWAMILALPLLLAYNWQKWRFSLKYLFYAFYPFHIWTLCILANLISLKVL